MRERTKVAIVTGAARGIGRAVAETLARDGAAVVIADLPASDGEATAAALRSQGRQAVFVAADVRTGADAMVAAALDSFGGLDILVNNAGIFYTVDALNTPFDEWMRAVEVIFHGAFLCSRAAARAMVDRGTGGRIVNVSSINAFPRPAAVQPLQHRQGRRRPTDALPGRRVGAIRHPCQRCRPRLRGYAHVDRRRRQRTRNRGVPGNLRAPPPHPSRPRRPARRRSPRSSPSSPPTAAPT